MKRFLRALKVFFQAVKEAVGRMCEKPNPVTDCTCECEECVQRRKVKARQHRERMLDLCWDTMTLYMETHHRPWLEAIRWDSDEELDTLQFVAPLKKEVKKVHPEVFEVITDEDFAKQVDYMIEYGWDKYDEAPGRGFRMRCGCSRLGCMCHTR